VFTKASRNARLSKGVVDEYCKLSSQEVSKGKVRFYPSVWEVLKRHIGQILGSVDEGRV